MQRAGLQRATAERIKTMCRPRKKIMNDEIDIIITIRGHKYGVRDDIKDKVPEVLLRTLLQCIKNTALLRLRYPDDTEEQLETRMQKGDPVTHQEMTI